MNIIHQFIKKLPKEVIQQAAKQLGLYYKKRITAESEQALDVLFNHIIFHHLHNNKKWIERCAYETKGKKISEEKLALLNTLQNASYGILSVLETLPFGGVHVEDCLNDRAFLLIDEGLSSSAQKGFLIATSYLTFPEFAMTTGAALPVIYHMKKIEELIDEFDINYRLFSELTVKQQSKFVTQLTKYSLEHGSLNHIDFIELPEFPKIT